MKKFITSFLAVSAVAVALTGCLKDKGFENGTYGINDPDTQPPGVGFPLGSNARNDYGLEVSASPQTVAGKVFVNLEAGTPASSDVHVTLSNTTAANIAAYNAANGTSIQAFPTALYSVATSLTIPAGARFIEAPLVISNTTGLNPNVQYAIGLTISAVDGGYKIADNLKTLFIVFNVKNKYDGKYNLKGVHNRSPYLFNFNTTVEMWTTGPASVAMFWPAGGDFGQPIGTAPGVVSWYGNAVSPNFIFDPSTNICTGITVQVGAAVTLGMVTNDAVADIHPDGPTPNYYDPATKKMYLTFQYNGNDLRRFYDTLTYLGPR